VEVFAVKVSDSFGIGLAECCEARLVRWSVLIVVCLSEKGSFSSNQYQLVYKHKANWIYYRLIPTNKMREKRVGNGYKISDR
jgi:hypothetical protein